MAGGSITSRETLRRQQTLLLRDLLEAIRESNPFYRAKLSPVALPDASDLGGLPFTTKSELVDDQRHHPPYGTNLTCELKRYTRCHQTSGSTGAALCWLDTPESWQWLLGNWRRIYEAAGVGPGARILFSFSFGPFLGFWSAFEAALQQNCFCWAAGGMSSRARLEAVAAHQIAVICCTPTYALRLGEVAAQEPYARARHMIQALIVAGEPGGSIPGTRARIKALWPGAEVFDHHGMTEVGPVSYQCPRQAGVLHIIEASYIAEIVDPHGAPVAAGELGELTLTTLGRTGSPLIRYRTGDLVRALAPARCACGAWDLGLDGGILGRVDDMFFIRGVNLYPAAVEELVRSVPGIGEFQVQVTRTAALPELSFLVERLASADPAAAITAGLEEIFHDRFALRVTVKEVPPGSLPRGEMKSQRWLFHRE